MVSLEEPQGPPQGHLGGLPVDFNCKDFAVGPSLPPLVQGSLHGELELRLLTISWKPPQPRRGVAGASRRAPPPRQLAVRLRWWGEPAPPAEGAPGSHGTLFRPRTTPSGHSAVLERDPSNTALFPVRCATEHLAAYLRDASASGGLVLELLGSSARSDSNSNAAEASASNARLKVIGRAIFDPAQLIKHVRSGAGPGANGAPLRHTCVLISRHDASRLGTLLVEGEVRMGTRSQLRAALLLAQSGEERARAREKRTSGADLAAAIAPSMPLGLYGVDAEAEAERDDFYRQRQQWQQQQQRRHQDEDQEPMRGQEPQPQTSRTPERNTRRRAVDGVTPERRQPRGVLSSFELNEALTKYDDVGDLPTQPSSRNALSAAAQNRAVRFDANDDAPYFAREVVGSGVRLMRKHMAKQIERRKARHQRAEQATALHDSRASGPAALRESQEQLRVLRDAARDAEASVAGERSNSGALAQDQAEPGNVPATSSLPAAPSATSVPPELRPLREHYDSRRRVQSELRASHEQFRAQLLAKREKEELRLEVEAARAAYDAARTIQ